jgi:hypothetical protein
LNVRIFGFEYDNLVDNSKMGKTREYIKKELETNPYI